MKKIILFNLVLALTLPCFGEATRVPSLKCPVVVIALVKVKSGFESAFRKNALAILSPTREEAGNISYNFHQSTSDSKVFDTFEQWESIDHLNEHLNSAHMKRFFAIVGPYFESRYPVIQTLKNIECSGQ